jgi:hypothetical protein
MFVIANLHGGGAVKGKGAKLEFKTVNGPGHSKTGACGMYLSDAVKWLRGEWK